MIIVGERPFKCQHCSRSFAEGSTLKSHIRTHTGEKPFKCQHCGKAFAHLSSHRKHTLTHSKHKSASPPSFKEPSVNIGLGTLNANQINGFGDIFSWITASQQSAISPSCYQGNLISQQLLS